MLDLDDRVAKLESEGYLDKIYHLISVGEPLLELANHLGLKEKELDYALKRSPAHQRALMTARQVALGSKSMDTLMKPHFSEATDLDKEEAAAATHHRAIIAETAKQLNPMTGIGESGGSRVVVNNQIVVVDANQAPPELPTQLTEILEHVPED